MLRALEFLLLLPRETFAERELLELLELMRVLDRDSPDRFALELDLLERFMLLLLRVDLLEVALWLLREDELLIFPEDLLVLR